MSAIEEARRLECEERYAEAAARYEIALASGEGTLDDYKNLAFLYADCQDFGTISHQRLDLEFVRWAETRMVSVLNEGAERFGEDLETRFLKRFVVWMAIAEEFDVSDFELEDEVPLVVMYQFAMLQREELYQRALEVRDSLQPNTARNRYILSVLNPKRLKRR